MKIALTDLDPRWWAEHGRDGQGMSFLCPHCRTTRIGVAFANPIDGGSPHPLELGDRLRHIHADRLYDVPPGTLWLRTGDTFDDLTLSPSVDASASGHWHGFVQNGAVT